MFRGDRFYDLKGVASSSGVSLTPVNATKGATIVGNGTTGDPDEYRVQYGTIHHDTYGKIGQAGRTHYWYLAVFYTANAWINTQYHCCYAYCDDYFAASPTWVKPNLGLVTFDGNTNNNICFTGAGGSAYELIAGVGVFPERDKPFVYLLQKGFGTGRSPELWESSSVYLQDATKIRNLGYSADHTEVARTNLGKLYVGQQWNYTTDSYPTVFRAMGVELYPDPFIGNELADVSGPYDWGGSSANAGGAVLAGQNIISNATNLAHGNYSEHHGGSYVDDYYDLWGRVMVVAPQALDTSVTDHQIATRIGTVRDIDTGRTFANASVYMPDASGEAIITNGLAGTDDHGFSTAVSGSLHRTAAGDDRLYYFALQQQNNVGTDLPQTTKNTGNVKLATFRQDGITKITGNGTLTTQNFTKQGGEFIVVNHSGDLSVEIRDSGGTPVTGYTTADCDLVNADSTGTIVTWSGDNASSLSGEYSLHFTCNGDLFTWFMVGSDDADYFGTDSPFTLASLSGTMTQIYKKHKGKTFSLDGVNYYSESGGVLTTTTAIAPTAYI